MTIFAQEQHVIISREQGQALDLDIEQLLGGGRDHDQGMAWTGGRVPRVRERGGGEWNTPPAGIRRTQEEIENDGTQEVAFWGSDSLGPFEGDGTAEHDVLQERWTFLRDRDLLWEYDERLWEDDLERELGEPQGYDQNGGPYWML